jgi:hypothetical protein
LENDPDSGADEGEADGPLIIDRDTINCGYILSQKGRAIATAYNSVHSGDYLGEMGDYFFRH